MAFISVTLVFIREDYCRIMAITSPPTAVTAKAILTGQTRSENGVYGELSRIGLLTRIINAILLVTKTAQIMAHVAQGLSLFRTAH